eukprot:46758_1
MAALKPKPDDNMIQKRIARLAKKANPHLASHEQAQLQRQMKMTEIPTFNYGVLSHANRETKQIKKWKKSKPEMQNALNGIQHNLEEYQAIMPESQETEKTALNLKASTAVVVHALNGLMAFDVMDAEMGPSQQVSEGYKMASAMAQQSMQNVAAVGVQTALYNQNNLLQDLNEEKAIQNDPNARQDVNAICAIDKKMRKKRMRLSRVKQHAEEMNRRYHNLQRNPRVPRRFEKRIKTQTTLWNVVIGIVKITGCVVVIAGIGGAIYVAGTYAMLAASAGAGDSAMLAAGAGAAVRFAQEL